MGKHHWSILTFKMHFLLDVKGPSMACCCLMPIPSNFSQILKVTSLLQLCLENHDKTFITLTTSINSLNFELDNSRSYWVMKRRKLPTSASPIVFCKIPNLGFLTSSKLLCMHRPFKKIEIFRNEYHERFSEILSWDVFHSG